MSSQHVDYSYDLIPYLDELVPDYEGGFWDDHDEDNGRPEGLEDEYPDGFKWRCCGSSRWVDGCKITPHESTQSKYGT